MNTIQQISLKLQLGLDPAANIHPDRLLQKWRAFSEKKCQGNIAARREVLRGTRPNSLSAR